MITAALDRFETVFAEEMRDVATYFVPKRGIFDTKALVDSADDASGVIVALHPD